MEDEQDSNCCFSGTEAGKGEQVFKKKKKAMTKFETRGSFSSNLNTVFTWY